MEQIWKSSIPLRLKNIKRPDGAGAVICPTSLPSISSSVSLSIDNPILVDSGTSTPQSVFMRNNGYHGDGRGANPISTDTNSHDSQRFYYHHQGAFSQQQQIPRLTGQDLRALGPPQTRSRPGHNKREIRQPRCVVGDRRGERSQESKI